MLIPQRDISLARFCCREKMEVDQYNNCDIYQSKIYRRYSGLEHVEEFPERFPYFVSLPYTVFQEAPDNSILQVRDKPLLLQTHQL